MMSAPGKVTVPLLALLLLALVLSGCGRQDATPASAAGAPPDPASAPAQDAASEVRPPREVPDETAAEEPPPPPETIQKPDVPGPSGG